MPVTQADDVVAFGVEEFAHDQFESAEYGPRSAGGGHSQLQLRDGGRGAGHPPP